MFGKKSKIDYKYNEDNLIKELSSYIDSTYDLSLIHTDAADE